jgi:hypothetical protein
LAGSARDGSVISSQSAFKRSSLPGFARHFADTT